MVARHAVASLTMLVRVSGRVLAAMHAIDSHTHDVERLRKCTGSSRTELESGNACASSRCRGDGGRGPSSIPGGHAEWCRSRPRCSRSGASSGSAIADSPDGENVPRAARHHRKGSRHLERGLVEPDGIEPTTLHAMQTLSQRAMAPRRLVVWMRRQRAASAGVVCRASETTQATIWRRSALVAAADVESRSRLLLVFSRKVSRHLRRCLPILESRLGNLSPPSALPLRHRRPRAR